MAKELVGFVGTGHMGGPMALRLLAAGYDVCIYDRDQKAENQSEDSCYQAVKRRSPAVGQLDGNGCDSPGQRAA